MEASHHFDHALLTAGALLLISVLSSKISTKFGIPALLIFIAIGMLAGADGPGGIDFSDYGLANKLGVLALVLILFAGGLDTDWHVIRPILLPGLSLATLGVAVTAAVVGVCAHYALGFSMLEGLLLGAVVSSTDAAAVFGVLRAQKLRLRGALAPLLELESGGNDPMAVFLTVALTGLVGGMRQEVWPLIPELILGLLIGAVGGLLIGRGSAWVINRIHLSFDGLYNVYTVGIALCAFAGIQSIGGNGFLAVYVAGVALGSRPFVHRISLIQFHEGLAWLMQIVMFLSLGLLVYPSHLAPRLTEGLIITFVLVFLARPLAVMLALAPFRQFSLRDSAFISWVGLRGAVPIILSTIPLMYGITIAPLLFNVVFFVVLVSVLVQGSTIRLAARLLGVISEEVDNISERKITSTKLEVRILPGSPVIGQSVVELNLPPSILLVLLTRGAESHIPRGNTVLKCDDVLLVQAQGDSINEVRRIFSTLKQSLKPLEAEVARHERLDD